MTADYAAPDYAEDHGYTTSLDRLSIVTATDRNQPLQPWLERRRRGGYADPGTVQVNVFYFPGWQVTVDGRLSRIRPSPTGAILVDSVPDGTHRRSFGRHTPAHVRCLALRHHVYRRSRITPLAGKPQEDLNDHQMRILAIETSCDETAAAVIEDGHRVLSNVVATQIELHRRFGGVFPEVASRQHVLSDPARDRPGAARCRRQPPVGARRHCRHARAGAGRQPAGWRQRRQGAGLCQRPAAAAGQSLGRAYLLQLAGHRGREGPTASAGDRFPCSF